MPRIGVTFDDVARAATKLLSTGDSPSVFKVREILGTGSNSTIAEHLKQWRQQRSEQRTVPLPDGIPKELVPPLETLWHIANEHADKRFIAYREQSEQKIEQLTTERDTWFAQHQQLESTLTEIKKQLEDAEVRNESHLQKNEAKEALNRELQTEKKNLTLEIKSLQQRLAEIQDNHAAREAALLDQHQQNQTQWQTVLDELRQALDQNHERAEATEARWLRVVDQARDESKRLRKQQVAEIKAKDAAYQKLQTQLQKTQDGLLSVQAELAKSQSRTEMHQNHCHSLEKEILRLKEESSALRKQGAKTKKQNNQTVTE